MEYLVMGNSVFSTLKLYFRSVIRGAASIWDSCRTALPYLFTVRSGDLTKEVTEQYPDPVSSRTADDLPPRTRGLLFNDIEKCTGCKNCEVVCPVKCIDVQTEPGAEASKLWVSVYDIDFAKCIFCGLCVEVCQPQSLVHTRQYEGAVYQLSDLVASFGRGRVTEEQKAKWAALRKAQETGERSL
jgi:formate hydrogenlyase subunit 6/NADH:ubiquinone oxidoreductase subunit I